MSTPRLCSRAFTLVEMLVVIIIITALLLIAVPSFQSMLNSSEAALADTMLKSGLRAGKDAALRSSGDQDSAVVFFYNPGGRLTLGIYIKAGSINDVDGSGNTVRRDVFVASGLNEPVQLPKGWMVRGFAPPNGTSNGSADATMNPSAEWYEPQPGRRPMNSAEGNWVFPETSYYNRNVDNDGGNRQTFMVVFEAGSGIMKLGAAETSLILAPGPDAAWRNNGVFANFRADKTDDAFRFATRILNAPLSGAGQTVVTETNRVALLGWACSDVILAKAVSQLALYQEAKLAAALGVRTDRTTDSIYLPFEPGTSVSPELVPRGSNFAGYTRDINRWISGDTNLDGINQPTSGTGQVLDAPEARIYTIDRYTGALQAVEVQ